MEGNDDLLLADKPETYHLGYLLSPLVPSDEVTATVEREIKQAIEKAAGRVVHEVNPRMLALAYPIKKVLEHKRTIFTQAYFGSIYFELVSTQLAVLEERYRKSPLLVRFLLTVYPAGAVKPEVKKYSRPTASGEVVTPPGIEKEKLAPEVMTSEAIDKEIEGLLTSEVR